MSGTLSGERLQLSGALSGEKLQQAYFLPQRTSRTNDFMDMETEAANKGFSSTAHAQTYGRDRLRAGMETR